MKRKRNPSADKNKGPETKKRRIITSKSLLSKAKSSDFASLDFVSSFEPQSEPTFKELRKHFKSRKKSERKALCTLTGFSEYIKGDQDRPDLFYVTLVDLLSKDKPQFGLFAADFIPEGTIIGEYTGELNTSIKSGTSQEVDHSYEFEVDENLFFNSLKKGNPIRFINNNPIKTNIVFTVEISETGEKKIIAKAARDIKKDEPFYASYGSIYQFKEKFFSLELYDNELTSFEFLKKNSVHYHPTPFSLNRLTNYSSLGFNHDEKALLPTPFFELASRGEISSPLDKTDLNLPILKLQENVILDNWNQPRFTLLMLAAHLGNKKAIYQLQDADPNIQMLDNDETALHLAIKSYVLNKDKPEAKSFCECIKILLKMGGNPFIPNKEGVSPLHLAIKHLEKDAFDNFIYVAKDFIKEQQNKNIPLDYIASKNDIPYLALLEFSTDEGYDLILSKLAENELDNAFKFFSLLFKQINSINFIVQEKLNFEAIKKGFILSNNQLYCVCDEGEQKIALTDEQMEQLQNYFEHEIKKPNLIFTLDTHKIEFLTEMTGRKDITLIGNYINQQERILKSFLFSLRNKYRLEEFTKLSKTIENLTTLVEEYDDSLIGTRLGLLLNKLIEIQQEFKLKLVSKGLIKEDLLTESNLILNPPDLEKKDASLKISEELPEESNPVSMDEDTPSTESIPVSLQNDSELKVQLNTLELPTLTSETTAETEPSIQTLTVSMEESVVSKLEEKTVTPSENLGTSLSDNPIKNSNGAAKVAIEVSSPLEEQIKTVERKDALPLEIEPQTELKEDFSKPVPMDEDIHPAESHSISAKNDNLVIDLKKDNETSLPAEPLQAEQALLPMEMDPLPIENVDIINEESDLFTANFFKSSLASDSNMARLYNHPNPEAIWKLLRYFWLRGLFDGRNDQVHFEMLLTVSDVLIENFETIKELSKINHSIFVNLFLAAYQREKPHAELLKSLVFLLNLDDTCEFDNFAHDFLMLPLATPKNLKEVIKHADPLALWKVLQFLNSKSLLKEKNVELNFNFACQTASFFSENISALTKLSEFNQEDIVNLYLITLSKISEEEKKEKFAHYLFLRNLDSQCQIKSDKFCHTFLNSGFATSDNLNRIKNNKKPQLIWKLIHKYWQAGSLKDPVQGQLLIDNLLTLDCSILHLNIVKKNTARVISKYFESIEYGYEKKDGLLKKYLIFKLPDTLESRQYLQSRQADLSYTFWNPKIISSNKKLIIKIDGNRAIIHAVNLFLNDYRDVVTEPSRGILFNNLQTFKNERTAKKIPTKSTVLPPLFPIPKYREKIESFNLVKTFVHKKQAKEYRVEFNPPLNQKLGEIETFASYCYRFMLGVDSIPEYRSIVNETKTNTIGLKFSIFKDFKKSSALLEDPAFSRQFLIKKGIVPLLVAAYVFEENFLTEETWGFNEGKVVRQGTFRMSFWPLTAKYSVKNPDKVEVPPSSRFTIEQIDIEKFPFLSKAAPNVWINNSLFDKGYFCGEKLKELLIGIENNPDFIEAKWKYFLKSLLMQSSYIAKLAEAAIGEQSTQTKYINHLTQRLQDLRTKLVLIPEFRDFLNRSKTVWQELSEEIERYNQSLPPEDSDLTFSLDQVVLECEKITAEAHLYESTSVILTGVTSD